MKIFKYLAGLIFALVFLFILVANFSTSTESYRCDGVLTNEDGTIEIPLFFELNRYRFWVGLWSDSYGDFKYEIPNTTVGTFLHLGLFRLSYGYISNPPHSNRIAIR